MVKITIEIEVDSKTLRLSEDGARELFGKLKNMFDKSEPSPPEPYRWEPYWITTAGDCLS